MFAVKRGRYVRTYEYGHSGLVFSVFLFVPIVVAVGLLNDNDAGWARQKDDNDGLKLKLELKLEWDKSGQGGVACCKWKMSFMRV